MEGTRFGLGPLLVGVVLGIALVAGCGGGDGDAEADEARESLTIEPARYMRGILDAVETAKTKADCKEVVELNLRSPYKVFCTTSEDFKKSTPSVKFIRAATYGPAAVIDYKSGQPGNVASIILIRDAKREWALNGYGLLSEESIGSDDAEGSDDARKAVDDYLAAVRERDCKDFDKFAVTSTSEFPEVCETDLAAVLPLTRFLNANPEVAPRYVGGNATYRFYRLDGERPKPGSYTVAVVKTPKGSLRPFVVLGSQRGAPPSG